jgi:hypothetical protein
MSFLTPLFLLGGLAIAGPILYHLVRRTTRERMRFSSLMFLLPSPPRLSKRHRIEHWLLLLLRCLALALLALGFARPFFKQTQLNDPTAVQPKRIVVLVDASASMRRAGLWDEARTRVEAVLRRARPTDQVAVYLFDRTARPLMGFDDWNRAAPNERVPLALGRLAGTAPGWAGTHLGNALVTAAEALAENEGKAAQREAAAAPEGPRQVVLVSDLQAGSRLDTLQAYEWPKGIELFIEPVKARAPTNAGVQLLAESSDLARPVDAGVRVRVTNSTEAKREQFKLGWVAAAGANASASGAAASGDFLAPPLDAYVPPGQSRVFTVPVPKGAAAERIVLRGDDDDFDNVVSVIPPVQQQATVLWLGNDAETDPKQPLYFVRRAFFDTPRLAVKLLVRGAAAVPSADELKAANLIFVSENLAPLAAAAVREQALAGKTVIFVPKTPAAAPTLGALLGREGAAPAMEEAKPASYAMFAEIDFRHPLLAPFGDPRFSDFTKIHIWKYRRLDAGALPEARVLVKFDSGDPALVEVPLGKGRVFVLATGWQPEDSQLAVSSKFVPLLWSWLDLAGGVAAAPAQYIVGETVALPAEHGAGSVRLPDGTSAALAADANGFGGTTLPGIYQLELGGRTQRFAVNLDANESRTTPLGFDELEELGLPIAKPQDVAAEATKQSTSLLQGVEAEGRQKLWRWFIVATLALLLIESVLAGWTARRALRTEEATP